MTIPILMPLPQTRHDQSADCTPREGCSRDGFAPSPLTLDEVVAALAAPGWRGFSLVRRFVSENPRLWRSVVRAARTVPWTKRADYAVRSVQMAMLGSFSTDNITDALIFATLERGLIANVYHAPFGQASFVVREPTSPLYTMQPDLVIVAVEPAVRFCQPWEYSGETSGAPPQQEIDRFLDDLLTEIHLVHERSGAFVIVHNFVPPEFRPLGLSGWRQENTGPAFYLRLNLALLERCRALPWIHVADLMHAQTLSAGQWTTLHQARFLGAYGLSAEVALTVAREYAAVAAALRGYTKKGLVVDLDNTLWGGVVAEDGVSGLAIGGGYPGNIYLELQRVIRALQERGVILAINSKNNEADAWEPFRQREEMRLRPEHFSAWRMNWRDKATNLREIAQELNLGMDSLVVLDDSPVERNWMESMLPEAHILHAEDPLEMVRLLSSSMLFDGLEISQEDRARTQSYTAAAQRRTAQAAAPTLEGFLAQLAVAVAVFQPQESQWGRVAQLTQKTNQFNLTTRRYTQEQLRMMCADDKVKILCCSVRDRFADEGIVGVVVLRKQEHLCVIDSFLLSCRVLGRGVERALLWAACQCATQWGGERIVGEHRCSEKNGQTARFFPEQGFELVSEDSTASLWTCSLPAPHSMKPDWIALTVREGAV